MPNRCLTNRKIQRQHRRIFDITERKRIEEQERFLAEASVLLATSLDYQATLETWLTWWSVADWCTIHIVESDQSLHQVMWYTRTL